MTDDIEKEIEGIIGQMKCPKGFICYKSGFKKLCKARDFGIENYLECLEDDPKACNFSIDYGGLHFCKCPLRYYLDKNRNKEEE